MKNKLENKMRPSFFRAVANSKPARVLTSFLAGLYMAGYTHFANAEQYTPIGDINKNGYTDSIDIQLSINSALGVDISSYNADVNNDSIVNAQDVQLVINSALGLIPERIYVDKNNLSGPWNGNSWNTAFTSIQEGVDNAYEYGIDEVLVGEGVYTSSNNPVVAMENGVNLYGGFIGIGNNGLETLLTQRDWNEHETIINGENARQCVIGADATLDGFVVENGRAEGDEPNNIVGGGMYNEFSSPNVFNCTFRGNSAGIDGGGMYNELSSPNVFNCTFTDNSAAAGGGINNWNSSPIIDNCTFTNNWAGRGGGISNVQSFPEIINCRFTDNSARGENGGGMYNLLSSPTISNCIFTNNIIYGSIFISNPSGGGIYNFDSSPILTNCLFISNGAYGDDSVGGGVCDEVYESNSSSNLINCTFIGNFLANYRRGKIGSGIFGGSSLIIVNSIFLNNFPNEIGYPEVVEPPTVIYSNIRGGYPGEGNMNINPQFVDPVTEDFHLLPTSPCIDAGTYIEGLVEDFEGDIRPYDGTSEIRGDGSDFDIGADEFVE